MRKPILVVCLSLLSAGLAMAQPLPAKVAAFTEGRVAVLWECAQPAPVNTLEAGDQAGHVFLIAQVKCTAARGDMAGVNHREGVGTEFHEIKGNAVQVQGVYVETLANGDKVSYTYKGTATLKDGKLESATNTWTATAGTGKFKGIKASGTCKAVGKPDGTSSFDCSGKYKTEF